MQNQIQFEYEISHPGEYDSGVTPYSENVKIILDSGNPGGDENEFQQYMEDCLAEWFDGARVVMTKSEDIHLDENKWTKEWPNEEGKFWFYGYRYGKLSLYDPQKPVLLLVKVIKTSGDLTYICNGQFMYKSEVEEEWFCKAKLPDISQIKDRIKKWYEFEYRGIEGDIEGEEGFYHMSSKNMKDLITAEGRTIYDLIENFKKSVDDYFKLKGELKHQ